MSDEFKIIKLPNGTLEHSALTAGEGPLVLCLHGFPDHPRTFRFLLPELAKRGFRAVAPFTRGYESSSNPPDGDFTFDALAGDVVRLLDSLEVERAHLVGHDWGGLTAYVVGAAAPERFKSITTIAVPHFSAPAPETFRMLPAQMKKSWYTQFLQLRGIAEWAVERNGWAFIRRLWRSWSPGYELPETEWDALVETMSKPGVKNAMIGYYRANLAPWKLPKLGFGVVPVPTLAVTGANDGCMDSRLYELVMKPDSFPRGMTIRRIENGGHFVQLERPDEVNAAICEWVTAHDSD